MVSKVDVLSGDWVLLRVEVADRALYDDMLDGYSRFWCKQAVLGTYWVAERVADNRVRLHLQEDIELEGFSEALTFEPDRAFKRELLSKFNWEEVVSQAFPAEDATQMSLFSDLPPDEEED